MKACYNFAALSVSAVDKITVSSAALKCGADPERGAHLALDKIARGYCAERALP